MGIFLGIIGTILGFLLVWKSEWILENFGRVDWAEQHLGSDGGTRIFYKLLGLAIIFISFMGITGLFGKFVLWIFSPLIRQ